MFKEVTITHGEAKAGFRLISAGGDERANHTATEEAEYLRRRKAVINDAIMNRGTLTVALMSEVGDMQELRDLLKAGTESGFEGLVVGSDPAFSAWTVTIPQADPETGNMPSGVIAVCSCSYVSLIR